MYYIQWVGYTMYIHIYIIQWSDECQSERHCICHGVFYMDRENPYCSVHTYNLNL